MNEPITLTIIVLSWNREPLLRGTVLSLLANTRSNFEMFVIDNGSSDGSEDWLKRISENYNNIDVILLKENEGGEAFNRVLSKVRGKYVMFSENDLEYLPGWDLNMIHKFEKFSELGQLSPFSPFPQTEYGEKWSEKPFQEIRDGQESLLLAVNNVGTSCMVSSDLIQKGVRWENIISDGGEFRFPADGKFSSDIKKLGKLVAWSDSYQAINWGHYQRIWEKNEDYYIKNWDEKSFKNIDSLSELKNFDTDGIVNLDDAKKILKKLVVENAGLIHQLDYLKKSKKITSGGIIAMRVLHKISRLRGVMRKTFPGKKR